MIGRRVVIAAVLLAVVVSTSVSAAGAAKPKQWVTVTNFWPESSGPSVVGSASGRAWIGFASDRSRTRLGSIRRIGGRLSFVRTDVVGQIPMMIVGSQLVFHTAGQLRQTRPPKDGATARERAGWRTEGGRGRSRRTSHPSSSILLHQRGNRSGRTVWILDGGEDGRGQGSIAQVVPLGLLHGADGELSELTRYIKQGKRRTSYAARRRRQEARLARLARDGPRLSSALSSSSTSIRRRSSRARRARSWYRAGPRLPTSGSCASVCRVVLATCSAVTSARPRR